MNFVFALAVENRPALSKNGSLPKLNPDRLGSMFERFKPAIYITLGIWGFMGLLYAFANSKAVVYSDNRARYQGVSTYDVWEIRVLQAKERVGRTYRIPVVADRVFNDTEDSVIGFIRGVSIKQVAVGAVEDVEASTVSFRGIGGGQIDLEPLSPEQLVKVQITHLKSCPVEMREDVETKMVSSGYNVIDIPKLKKVEVRKFSKPACAAADDLQTTN